MKNIKYIKVNKAPDLCGEISIGGSKNSALSCIVATCILDTSEKITLNNIPDVTDVHVLISILKHLGKKIIKKGHSLIISGKITSTKVPSELAREIRGSTYLMGLLLGLKGSAECGLPGGDKIGERPIDLHLKAFEQMGAQYNIRGSTVLLRTQEKLTGANIYLGFPSVGATCNIMIAAALAEGKTTISNAAKEPEVVDLANLLNKMGIFVTGAGSDKITITPNRNLKANFSHDIIPDRIETGAFLLLTAAIGGSVTLNNTVPHHNHPLISVLKEAGAEIAFGPENESIHIQSSGKLKPIDITALPFPGIATDLQPFLTVFALRASGESKITDLVFPERFAYIYELIRLGANIKKSGNTLHILGNQKLYGTHVEGNDIRAVFALIFAGFISDGTTTVTGIEHLNRGFENLKDKFQLLGAQIEFE